MTPFVVQAQQAPAPARDDSSASLEEVVITGSRITTGGFNVPMPAYVKIDNLLDEDPAPSTNFINPALYDVLGNL